MYPRIHIQEAPPVPGPEFHDMILDLEQMPNRMRLRGRGQNKCILHKGGAEIVIVLG